MERPKPADKIVREDWGSQVRAARIRLELSQVAVAERLGIDQSTLSRIETGDYRAMTPDLILQLCLALKMDIRSFSWPRAIVEIAEMRAGAGVAS